MVDREEHLKISDLLYDKARELNLQEDIISRMLSSECLLVSFDHMVEAFLYDWNYQLYHSDAGRKIMTNEFQNFVIMKLTDKEAECIIRTMDKAFILRNKILYLKRTPINWVRISAQQEVNVLIDESENARNIIKTRML